MKLNFDTVKAEKSVKKYLEDHGSAKQKQLLDLNAMRKLPSEIRIPLLLSMAASGNIIGIRHKASGRPSHTYFLFDDSIDNITKDAMKLRVINDKITQLKIEIVRFEQEIEEMELLRSELMVTK